MFNLNLIKTHLFRNGDQQPKNVISVRVQGLLLYHTNNADNLLYLFSKYFISSTKKLQEERKYNLKL